MATSMYNKKKTRLSRKVEAKEFNFFYSILAKALFRIPAFIGFLILIFIWSSSTTIISGKIVHVCVSSRKLNNLYCISAGTQIPIPLTNGSSTSIAAFEGLLEENNEEPTSYKAEMKYNTNEVMNKATENSASLIQNSREDRYEDEEVANAYMDSISAASSNVENNEEPTSYKAEMQNNTNEVMNNATENSAFLVQNSREGRYRDEELANAYMDVEEQLRVHRSWISTNQRNGNCEGRGIYVYELPSKFNKDLLDQCDDMIPWMSLCKYFNYDALGEPVEKLGKGWHKTHQYALEPIFHAKVLNHPCRVHNENEAKLFYVPFYGGLDILRWHFKNVTEDVKDLLGLELVRWLETQRPWYQKFGKDHVFVLGKISWDFRRESQSSWGTKFLELDEMQNPIKILIERQPWHVNDIGIPHPTYFHPQTDDDIIKWQMKIISSYRGNLASFAGADRPDSHDNIRSILIEQCTTSNGECKFLNCSSGVCDQPKSLIDLFAKTEFCLQPPGDSPTRKSVFDSLISGCIPVIFDPFTAYYQYPWHLPEDHQKYSVFIDKDELRSKNMINVIERLAKIPQKERENMRRYIVYEVLPGLVYATPNSKLEKFQDAFSITMNNLIERMNRL